MRIIPGLTAYAASRINSDYPLVLFYIFFNQTRLRNIQKCTVADAKRVTGDLNWKLSLEKLQKYLGLIITQGVSGSQTLPILMLWNMLRGCPLFGETVSS